MKKITKYEAIKLLLIVSFLVTVFLALVSLFIFPNNQTINSLHLWTGIVFSVLAIFHIVSHSKKHN